MNKPNKHSIFAKKSYGVLKNVEKSDTLFWSIQMCSYIMSIQPQGSQDKRSNIFFFFSLKIWKQQTNLD